MSQQSDVPVEVVVAAFDSEKGAEDALHALKEIRKEGLIDIENAAVLWKDDKGKLRFKETADMRGGRGAVVGGVVGGVVGLIFPPSMLATAAVGAAIGGLSARLRDSGFPDERLRQVGEGLKPNTSALIAVIDHVWVLQVEEELRKYGADVITEAVRADIAAQLESEAPVPVPVSSEGAAMSDTAPAQASTTSPEMPAQASTMTPETPMQAPSSATETPPPDTSTGGTTTSPA